MIHSLVQSVCVCMTGYDFFINLSLHLLIFVFLLDLVDVFVLADGLIPK